MSICSVSFFCHCYGIYSTFAASFLCITSKVVNVLNGVSKIVDLPLEGFLLSPQRLDSNI